MFIGNTLKDDNLALTRQETVNWYMETQGEGARGPKALIGAPGTGVFAEIGDGRIKAAINHNENYYVVSGTDLYRVLTNGTGVLLGSLDESNPPSLVANLTQVVVINGVSGYVWDETTETFTKITDPNFYPTSSGCYMDGYLIFVRDGTGQFFVSDVDDALTYPALNFDEAVLRGDILEAVVSDTRNLYLVGRRTVEPWRNTGELNGVPFTPIAGAATLRGTVAGKSVVSSQAGTFFLGDDSNVYMMQSYTPQNIATDAIAKELTRYRDMSNAYAFMMNMDGHWFYVLTLPDQGRTFVYDPEENAWHNRESYGLGYWRANSWDNIFGYNMVTDSQSNKIGILDRRTYTEYDEPWVCRRVSGVYASKNKLVSANRLELVFASGQVPQNVTHQARLRYSDDKGMTFGNPVIETIGTAGHGQDRCIWWNMGSFRDRVYELLISTRGNRDLLEEDFIYEVGGE